MSLVLHKPKDLKESTILSYATQIGDIAFTSGLTPRDPSTGEIVEGGIEVQAPAAFNNLSKVLVAIGASPADVAKVNVYLTNIADATKMNEVYKEFFGDHKPARTTVEISSLTPGMLIEIEAIVALS
jgi:reactive intermediate/imine deaminase